MDGKFQRNEEKRKIFCTKEDWIYALREINSIIRLLILSCNNPSSYEEDFILNQLFINHPKILQKLNTSEFYDFLWRINHNKMSFQDKLISWVKNSVALNLNSKCESMINLQSQTFKKKTKFWIIYNESLYSLKTCFQIHIYCNIIWVRLFSSLKNCGTTVNSNIC